MKTVYVKIEGVYCDHCIQMITHELKKIKNVKDISIQHHIATITYDKKISHTDIIDSINGLDYFTKEEYISENIKDLDQRISISRFLYILLVIGLIWFLIQAIFGFNIFSMIPSIDSSVTYGMIFIIGILTSIHCIFMCGAINLFAIVDCEKRSFKKPLFYNLGRVISYTIIGGFAGALGSVFQLHSIVNGIILIIASLLMILMSLQMLRLIDIRFKFRLPFHFKSRNSFVIGLLNGFMSCGPLQAMQLYALSTGSFFMGALSMFLFALGTVPLMLGIGLFYTFIQGKSKLIVHHITCVLLFVLSFIMLHRGLLALNIDITKPFKNYDQFTKSHLVEDYQVVEFDLDYNHYEDILVQKGIPVQMIIHVDQQHLTGCNHAIEMKDFQITKTLEEGDNLIEFTPKKVGTYTYTCWMNMIQNHIKVVDDISYFKED